MKNFITAILYIIGGAILLMMIIPVEAVREIHRRVRNWKR